MYLTASDICFCGVPLLPLIFVVLGVPYSVWYLFLWCTFTTSDICCLSCTLQRLITVSVVYVCWSDRLCLCCSLLLIQSSLFLWHTFTDIRLSFSGLFFYWISVLCFCFCSMDLLFQLSLLLCCTFTDSNIFILWYTFTHLIVFVSGLYFYRPILHVTVVYFYTRNYFLMCCTLLTQFSLFPWYIFTVEFYRLNYPPFVGTLRLLTLLSPFL